MTQLEIWKNREERRAIELKIHKSSAYEQGSWFYSLIRSTNAALEKLGHTCYLTDSIEWWFDRRHKEPEQIALEIIQIEQYRKAKEERNAPMG